MNDPVRPIADQRRLLVATIRGVADWRRGKIDEYADDDYLRKQNTRAKKALLTLANFVEQLPDDDRDLDLHALRRLEERKGQLQLTQDGRAMLSQFGLSKGSWNEGRPSENQMRNILRRIDGVEAKERRARRERAEAGYGDD